MVIEPNVTLLTFYGDSISGNCLKCKWTADFLKLQYSWVEISVVKGQAKSAEFVQKINPVGQVPVARWPNGRILSQSNAIILFLAAGSTLIPSDPFQQAQMHSWMFWEQYSHETAIAVRRFKLSYQKLTENEIDPNLFTKGNQALVIMESQLTQTDWFVGTSMTCADVALVAYTRVAPEGGFDLTQYPAVVAWIDRVEKALGIV